LERHFLMAPAILLFFLSLVSLPATAWDGVRGQGRVLLCGIIVPTLCVGTISETLCVHFQETAGAVQKAPTQSVGAIRIE
jgi:hypothetical protein